MRGLCRMNKLNLKMDQLAKLLKEKSLKLNLFSQGDREKLLEKHIPDSLAVLDFWKAPRDAKVMDLGTGGGLPGLALAMARPDLHFVLVDAREKKVKAVQEIVRELGLGNVKAVAARAEQLAHSKEYREKMDAITARALAPLPTLLEYAAGFLKRGGWLYAWKSKDYLDELSLSKRAQEILGVKFEKAHSYSLPSGEDRVIMAFQKVAATPAQYPRRPNLPQQKPL